MLKILFSASEISAIVMFVMQALFRMFVSLHGMISFRQQGTHRRTLLTST